MLELSDEPKNFFQCRNSSPGDCDPTGLDGAWTLVFYKGSPGSSMVQPGLKHQQHGSCSLIDSGEEFRLQLNEGEGI